MGYLALAISHVALSAAQPHFSYQYVLQCGLLSVGEGHGVRLLSTLGCLYGEGKLSVCWRSLCRYTLLVPSRYQCHLASRTGGAMDVQCGFLLENHVAGEVSGQGNPAPRSLPRKHQAAKQNKS